MGVELSLNVYCHEDKDQPQHGVVCDHRGILKFKKYGDWSDVEKISTIIRASGYLKYFPGLGQNWKWQRDNAMESKPSPPLHPVSQEVLSAGSTVVAILRQCQIAYQKDRTIYGFLFGTSRLHTITRQEDHGSQQCSSRLFGNNRVKEPE